MLIYLTISFIFTTLVLTILYSHYIQRKRKQLAFLKKERESLAFQRKLLFKEKENEELNVLALQLQNELKVLKREKNQTSNLQAIIEKKEKEIQLLKEEGARRFRSKPIYEILEKIEKDKNIKLNIQQLEKLEQEINSSFKEYLKSAAEFLCYFKANTVLI